MPDNDKIQALYNTASQKFAVGTIDEFTTKLADPAKRKVLYDALSQDYDVGDYGSFNMKLGFDSPDIKKQYNEADYPTFDEDNQIKQLRDLQKKANTPNEPDMVISSSSMGVPVISNFKKGIYDKQKIAKTDYDTQLNSYADLIGAKPEDLKQVMNDAPYLNNAEKIKGLVDLKADNTYAYNRLLPMQNIVYSLASKAGTHTANEFNALQDANSLQQGINNTLYQQQIINKHFTGDERDKLQADLMKNKAPLFNASNPELLNDYNASDLKNVVDPLQYSALKLEQVFNPGKYKTDIALLTTQLKPEYELTTDVSNSNNGLLFGRTHETETQDSINKRKGRETLLQSLAETGRQNTMAYLNEQLHDLDAKYKQAEKPEEKNALVEQYNQLQTAANAIDADRKQDDNKYPLLAQLKFDDQVKELTQDAGMNPLEYGFYRFSKNISNSGASLENIATRIFGGKEANAQLQLQRLGELKEDESTAYMPESLKATGSDFIPAFPKELKQQANSITGNKFLSEDDKQQQLARLVQDNQDRIDYTTNPEAGKDKNFWSKATLYGNAGMLGDIAAFAAQQYATGGLGKLVSTALPMYLGAQNDYYKQAIAEGNPNPQSYANTHATIMALAGLINPDINIVKRTLGMNTMAGKFVAGLDEKTWNSVIDRNKPLLDKFKNSALSVAKEAGKMTAVYGAGTSIASDVANNLLFNQNKSAGDIIDDAVKASKETALNSIALFGINAITNFKSVSPQQKAAVWELGVNPDITKQQINEAVKNGDITQAQAAQRSKIVDEVSSLINAVPTTNAKGELLTDRQKTDYLYNQLIKNKADEIKQSLPAQQQGKINEAIQQAENNNNAIIENETPLANNVEAPAAETTIAETNNSNKQNSIPAEDEIKIGELIDKPVVYDGKKATLYQDGQTVVAKIEGENREYELGNIDEIKNAPISDFNIEHETSVVGVDDNGDISIRDTPYKNNYSNPLAAINYGNDGNVVSVNLETTDGKKRTFRDNIAEDIAYQIHLKEITKDNATRTEFEDFINNNEATAKQVNNAAVPEPAKKATTENNATVQRTKAKQKQAEPITDKPVKEKVVPKVQAGRDENVTNQKQAKLKELAEKHFKKPELKIVDDAAENEHANRKLADKDSIEQEPNVKAIESAAENSNEAAELERANQQAEQLRNNALDIEVKPVSEIHTDESRFQGREKLNEEKVNELKNEIETRQDKINELKARFTDPSRKDYISTESKSYDDAKSIADNSINKLNDEIKSLQKKLQEHYQDKGKFLDNKQQALFEQDKNDKAETTTEATIKKFTTAAEMVVKKLYPKAKVETYNTEAEYIKAGGSEGERGKAIMNKNGEHRLMLNLEAIKADKSPRTAIHEALHPIVYDKYGVDTKKLNSVWNDIVKQTKGIDGMDAVWRHVALYDESKHAPEGITEFLTQVVQGNIDISRLPSERKNAIIRTINKLLDALGIKLQIGSPDDLKKFANDIKAAFETGDTERLKGHVENKGLDKYFEEQDIMRNKVSESDLTHEESKLRDFIDDVKKALPGITAKEIKEVLPDEYSHLTEQDINKILRRNAREESQFNKWVNYAKGQLITNQGKLTKEEFAEKFAERFNMDETDPAIEDVYNEGLKAYEAEGKRNLNELVHNPVAEEEEAVKGKKYVGIIPAIRDYFTGNLNQLGKLSPEAKQAAVQYASSASQASMVIRKAVTAITDKYGASMWIDLRKALVQSRLDGIRERWQQMADAVKHTSDEELIEGVRGNIGDVLDNIEVKSPLENLRKDAEALVNNLDFDQLRQLLKESFEYASDHVANIDFSKGRSYDEIVNGPEFKGALDLYKSLVEKPIRDNHASNEGLFSDALGKLDTYFPLIPMDVKGNLLSRTSPQLNKPVNLANKFATGLSNAYDISVSKLNEQLTKAFKNNNKAVMVKALEDAGLIKTLSPYDSGSKQLAINGEIYKARTIPIGENTVKIVNGKKTVVPPAKVIIPDWLYKELKPMLENNYADKTMFGKVMDGITSFALGGIFEPAIHTANLVGGVVNGTPFPGTSLASKTIGNIPVTKIFASIFNMLNEDVTSPKAIEHIQDMAKLGLISERTGHVTWNSDTAEATGAKKVLPTNLSPFLYGKKGIDLKARVLMDRIALEVNPKASPEERRQFANQLGNYVFKLEGQLGRTVKANGLSPFFTASSTFLKNGIKGWLGITPLPTKNLSLKDKMGYRAAQLFSAGAIGLTATWALAYKANTGKYPWQDDDSRFLMIPLNDDELNYIDKHPFLQKIFYKNGKPQDVNMGFFNRTLDRGARGLGLSAAYNTIQSDGNAGQIAEAMYKDQLNSFLAPLISAPAVHTFATMATGHTPYIIGLRDYMTGEPSIQFARDVKTMDNGFKQFGANAAQGIMDINPLIGMIADEIGMSFKPKWSSEDEESFNYMRMMMNLTMPNFVKPHIDNDRQSYKLLQQQMKIEQAAAKEK